MEDILHILIKIQKFDDEIKDTTSKIETIPDKIAALEREIEKAQVDLREKQSRAQKVRKDYIMKEGDIAENESKITKLNSQTFAVKTNEEYRAILSEVEYLRKENKKTEDEMMDLLEEEERLRSTIKRNESETNALVNERRNRISDLERENQELTEKLKKLKADFDAQFSEFPENLREQYKKIKKVRGNAVCLINGETCTGCYANLTPQFFNELKKRKEILLCDNCGRMLVYVASDKDL